MMTLPWVADWKTFVSFKIRGNFAGRMNVFSREILSLIDGELGRNDEGLTEWQHFRRWVCLKKDWEGTPNPMVDHGWSWLIMVKLASFWVIESFHHPYHSATWTSHHIPKNGPNTCRWSHHFLFGKIHPQISSCWSKKPMTSLECPHNMAKKVGFISSISYFFRGTLW